MLASPTEQRKGMVRFQIVGRGIRDPAVLDAFESVPRELFLPAGLREFAYQDSALPIEQGQTLSQPYIVALMTAALGLGPEDRVLEIGTGSGYSAAILARIARAVYTIERHPELAGAAARRLAELGHENVSVRQGDGSLGWPEQAPFDAIVVAAGGPGVPAALLEQLAPEGRLVMPVGEGRELQKLVRMTRDREGRLSSEDLGDVRFVPLIGTQAWEVEEAWDGSGARSAGRPASLARLIHEEASALREIEGHDFGALLERIGDARLVLIGEASYGTSEFHRFRAELTKELIGTRGFEALAVEADWPDGALVNRWGLSKEPPSEAGARLRPFQRSPSWSWSNRETLTFVDWLREHNARVPGEKHRVSFYGLDVYSSRASTEAVVAFLDRVDPDAARVARRRYSCLSPWQAAPSAYLEAAASDPYRLCEKEAVSLLRDLMERRLAHAQRERDSVLGADSDARSIAGAEHYYRSLYRGSSELWNLRAQHMFDTLEAICAFHGPGAKVVVWAHNGHLGDASATEIGRRGHRSLGQLCREKYGPGVFCIGSGSHRGSVGAAASWDGPMRVMPMQPAHPESYEGLCHEAGIRSFLLHLREPDRDELRFALEPPRLERAIGVVYRPETELQSHYFHASLPRQFDEYAWFDATRAVKPLTTADRRGLSRGHPFAG